MKLKLILLFDTLFLLIPLITFFYIYINDSISKEKNYIQQLKNIILDLQLNKEFDSNSIAENNTKQITDILKISRLLNNLTYTEIEINLKNYFKKVNLHSSSNNCYSTLHIYGLDEFTLIDYEQQSKENNVKLILIKDEYNNYYYYDVLKNKKIQFSKKFLNNLLNSISQNFQNENICKFKFDKIDNYDNYSLVNSKTIRYKENDIDYLEISLYDLEIPNNLEILKRQLKNEFLEIQKTKKVYEYNKDLFYRILNFLESKSFDLPLIDKYEEKLQYFLIKTEFFLPSNFLLNEKIVNEKQYKNIISYSFIDEDEHIFYVYVNIDNQEKVDSKKIFTQINANDLNMCAFNYFQFNDYLHICTSRNDLDSIEIFSTNNIDVLIKLINFIYIDNPFTKINTNSYNKNQYIPVLMYHHIGNEYNPFKGYDINEISINNFYDQVKFLYENEYNFFTTTIIHKLIETNKKIPEKSIVITFDDGYKDNYTEAYRILKDFGAVAEFFIIPNLIGNKYYMNEEEIKELINSGIGKIGSHTLSHPRLDLIPKTELKNEIESSKNKIESIFKVKVESFCYPYGKFNQNTLNMVQNVYLTAVTAKYNFEKWNLIEYKREQIPRIWIGPNMGIQQFSEIITRN